RRPMMMQLRRAVTSLLLTLAVLMWGPQERALAQYPSKRITLVVPFGAGGSNDILARAIGQKLSERWRVPVVVENVAGASGSLGGARGAQAPPGRHTPLVPSSAHTPHSACLPVLASHADT